MVPLQSPHRPLSTGTGDGTPHRVRICGPMKVFTESTSHLDDLGRAGRIPRFGHLARQLEPSREEDSTEADADGPSGRKGTESWIDSRTFW